MFGLGKRSTRSGLGRGGVFSGGGLRRAAIAGLGMLAYRWWRNRHAGSTPATGNWQGAGEPAAGNTQRTGSGEVW